jgi:hypothetical protein
MAWFTFKCPAHGEFRVSLVRRERVVSCPTCKTESKAVIRTGSISVVEQLDNGAMARKVERLHNIEEIMSDRADKHSENTEESE